MDGSSISSALERDKFGEGYLCHPLSVKWPASEPFYCVCALPHMKMKMKLFWVQ